MGRVCAWGLALLLAGHATSAYARDGVSSELFPSVATGEALPGKARGFCVPMSLLSLLHIGGGAALPVGADAGLPTGYFIDVSDSLRCGMNRNGSAETAGLLLVPQVGYTAQISQTHASHYGRFGLAVGYGNVWASIHYAPRIVLGSREGEPALGIRHGITAYLLLDIFGVDLGHQVLFSPDRIENDLRISLHMNLLVFLWLLGSVR